MDNIDKTITELLIQRIDLIRTAIKLLIERTDNLQAQIDLCALRLDYHNTRLNILEEKCPSQPPVA
jgi:hypothetical protein